MSSLFYLFFYSFVEYVDIDTSTYLKAPGPSLWGTGEMAERGFDLLGLCLKTAVLSDCSHCLIMFFSFPQWRATDSLLFVVCWW